MPSLGGWEFVILIGILVLLFGAKRLPDMARSVGQSARVFKGEMKGLKNDDDKGASTPQAGTQAPPPAAGAPEPPAPPALPGTPPQQRPATDPDRAAHPGDAAR